MIQFKDEIIAIVYATVPSSGNGPGNLITIEIMSNGSIKKETVTVVVDSIGQPPQITCHEPCIIKVSDNVIAIAYREQGTGHGHRPGT